MDIVKSHRFLPYHKDGRSLLQRKRDQLGLNNTNVNKELAPITSLVRPGIDGEMLGAVMMSEGATAVVVFVRDNQDNIQQIKCVIPAGTLVAFTGTLRAV